MSVCHVVAGTLPPSLPRSLRFASLRFASLGNRARQHTADDRHAATHRCRANTRGQKLILECARQREDAPPADGQLVKGHGVGENAVGKKQESRGRG